MTIEINQQVHKMIRVQNAADSMKNQGRARLFAKGTQQHAAAAAKEA